VRRIPRSTLFPYTTALPIFGMHGRQHEVTGQRRLDGDLRRLQIANLADHDHVRVLADDGTQRVREGEIDLRLDLDLVDARHLVLDWVLYGENLDVGLVKAIERGVERGRLAATGRPGDQKNAVGLHQYVEKSLEGVVLEAQTFEIERDAAFVENPHDHRLTVHR